MLVNLTGFAAGAYSFLTVGENDQKHNCYVNISNPSTPKDLLFIEKRYKAIDCRVSEQIGTTVTRK